MTKYSEFTRKEIIRLFQEKNNSIQIGDILNIPSFAVRRIIRKNGLNFGHKTPFKANVPINIDENFIYIMNGFLLGDGCVKNNFTNPISSKKNVNSCLTIVHSKVQSEYAKFCYDLINNYIKSYISYRDPLSKVKIINNRIIKDNGSVVISTTQNISFNKYRTLWYQDKKIIPKDIKLNAQSLALWYMDDGMTKKNAGCLLHTNSFTVEEVNFLRGILKNQFNLESTLVFKNKQPVIYIRRKSKLLFFEIIKSFMCNSMNYKLDM